MLLGGSDVTDTVDRCETFEEKLGFLDMCQHLTDGQFLTTTLGLSLWMRTDMVRVVSCYCLCRLLFFHVEKSGTGGS